jgi:hypothetical protein
MPLFKFSLMPLSVLRMLSYPSPVVAGLIMRGIL